MEVNALKYATKERFVNFLYDNILHHFEASCDIVIDQG